jgi:hypothetical protein
VIDITGHTVCLWIGRVYLNGVLFEESYVPTNFLTAAASAVLAADLDE